MARNLGFLTSYGIEYVHDFLGKDRIDAKLLELKDKPTMGIRFEAFMTENSHFNGKGVFFIFSLLLQWFEKDLDLYLFLYEKSKNYNEQNYFNNNDLRGVWIDFIENNNRMKTRDPNEAAYWESQNINPFWIEYHYFVSNVIQAFMKYKLYQSDKNIEAKLVEIYGVYFKNSGNIINRFKLDKLLWPETGLGNVVFAKMKSFYKWKKDISKVNEIHEFAVRLGWRL